MTKQEKIQECWIKEIGVDAYESDVKGFIDDNGWVDIKIYLLKDNYLQSRPIREGFSPASFLRRPISLKGIENNNGWVKIYCENDMPQFECECYVISNVSRGIIFSYWSQFANKNKNKIARKFWLDNFSHYKIIETQKQPLY